MMSSAQGIVEARAWAPCDKAIQHCLKNFGFQHADLQLNGMTWSVVQFEGVVFAPVDFDKQVGVVVKVHPWYTKSCGCLCASPVASPLNVAEASETPVDHKYVISILACQTVRPNAAHSAMTQSSSSCVTQVIVRQVRHPQHIAYPIMTSPGLNL